MPSTNEPRLPLDVVDVTFSTGGSQSRTVALDMDRAKACMNDDETDIGPIVARLLAEDIVMADPMEHAGSTGMIVSVAAPDDLAGEYAVAMRLRVAVDGPRTDKTQHSSRDLSEFTRNDVVPRDRLRFGFLGRRLQPSTATKMEKLLLVARMMSPNAVIKSYDILGSVYGDEGVHDVLADEQSEVLHEIIRRQNEAFGYHDRGWAARSKVTGEVGFLVREGNEIKNLDDYAMRNDFWARHGLVLQHCTRDFMGEEVDLILCFVPGDRLDEVPAIAGEIEDLARGPLDPANVITR